MQVNRARRLGGCAAFGIAHAGVLLKLEAAGIPIELVAGTSMSSVKAVQFELGEFKSTSADVRIAVDLAGFTWIEFYRAVEILERGREAAKAAVPAVRRVLDAPRLSAPLGIAS